VKAIRLHARGGAESFVIDEAPDTVRERPKCWSASARPPLSAAAVTYQTAVGADLDDLKMGAAPLPIIARVAGPPATSRPMGQRHRLEVGDPCTV
jgi:hypothetical protein